MIIASAAYLFRHAVVRDAAYEIMLPSTRAALHIVAAELSENPVEAADQLYAARQLDESQCDLEHEVEVTRTAAEFARRTFANRQAEQLYLRLAELERGVSKVKALRLAGVVAGQAARVQDGLKYIEEALTLARQVEDAQSIGACAGNLASLKMYTGQVEVAEALFTESIQQLSKTGDERGRAIERANLASVRMLRGQLDDAAALLEAALEIHRLQGDHANEGAALTRLGLVYMRQQKYELAEDKINRALELQSRAGNKRLEGENYAHRAALLRHKSDYASAEEAARFGIELLRKTGDRRREGDALGELAKALAAKGEFEKALSIHGQALAIHREVGSSISLARELGNMGLLYRQMGDRTRARDCLVQAKEIFQRTGDVRSVAAADEALAGLES